MDLYKVSIFYVFDKLSAAGKILLLFYSNDAIKLRNYWL